MALVQLTGGAFQDAEGNVLNNGFLTMTLSHDEQDPATSTQIAAGIPVKIFLDNNGNVSGTQKVWATDVLLPPNAYYIVEAFRSDGTMAWISPQNQLVPSGSSLNVGTWVPNLPGVPPTVQVVTFQTNGVNNISQSLLNIAAGSNITAVNSGGTVTLSAAGSSFTTSGQGFYIAALGVLPVIQGSSGTPGDGVGTDNKVVLVQMVIQSTYTFSKVSADCTNAAGLACTMCVGIYSFDGLTRYLSTNFNANSATIQTNTISPVTLAPGVYWFAFGKTNNSPQFSLHTNAIAVQNTLNAGSTLIGNAANPISGGNLPATLGAISAQSAGAAANIPLVTFVV